MVDIIPPFFTKRDFWAILLPGYTLVTLGIFLFFPTLIVGNNGGIVPDLFTIVVFIVGGPVAGFILLQFYYYISAYSSRIGSRKKFDFRRKYEQLKLKCSDKERLELDELEGRHFFGESTGIALAVLGILAIGIFATELLVTLNVLGPEYSPCYLRNLDSLFCASVNDLSVIRNSIVISVIFILAGILYRGSYQEYNSVHLHLICNLIEKYSIEWPAVCVKIKYSIYEDTIEETLKFGPNGDEDLRTRLNRIKSNLDLEYKMGKLTKSSYDKLVEKLPKNNERMQGREQK